MRQPRILVAGAGLGGLTAALALLHAGCEVAVFEQAPVLDEVGAGVQISANGTRVLAALGLAGAMARIAWEPKGKEVRLWNTGETWPLFDLGVESVRVYGFPYYMFHRADLHAALVAGVRRLQRGAIHLGATAIGFEQSADGVALRLADGREFRGDALIGADGVHSAIRRALFGDDAPAFTGIVAWRGIVPADRLPKGLVRPVGTNWIGPGGHVIHYFLRRGELLNFVGVRERQDWQVESWSAEGTVGECLADFSGWHRDILAIIRNIERPFKWALMSRPPLPRWSVGRVSLLGDACHPTLPFLAQGAVMAIEDGCVLARCIGAMPDDPAGALRRYEAARRERAARIVLGSAENAQRFHNPLLAERDHAARYVAEQWHPDRVKERYDWLFAYNALTTPI
jgi:salicylate hydroxylase